MSAEYTEDNIKSLDWKEHIRLRPGMYIGKLGNGSSPDDGIYILIKEVIDNSIDEYVMGFGKRIDIQIDHQTIYIRDYGRGIPLENLRTVLQKLTLEPNMIQKLSKSQLDSTALASRQSMPYPNILKFKPSVMAKRALSLSLKEKQ